MLAHPLETIGEIKEAVTTLANLKQEDLVKIYNVLKAEGKALIFEKDISEVSHDMGKVVGAALVELALGKGIGVGLKALRGLPAATAFLQKANVLKQTIGKLPIPTAEMKVVDFGSGLKMSFSDVELTKLADIVKMIKSSDESLGMLKNGSTAGTKTKKRLPKADCQKLLNPT